jgi:MmeI, DNA-methyltransferase domain/MmeI, N-terminal domain/MmeI, helicase spacer domain/MmeI, target recognition domain
VIHQDRATRLAEFVAWVAANIRGDEKGEAQVFLDRLFQGFGHAGVREAGAVLEDRVKKTSGKGTSFVDLVWKPVVLIEMKKRGEDLTRHYRQAFDYWTRLVPGRPRYVILCNFDEFWVYDFDVQMDAPVDRVKVTELTTRWGSLAFLFPTPEKPIFRNDLVAVTRQAAHQLALCFNKMVDTNRPGVPVERPDAQRFLLQMLVALFAEDIDLLPRYTVANLLDDCNTKQDSRDLIGGLFEAMNTRDKTADDRYQGVAYFDGGLFAQPARVELRLDEVDLLRAASKEDWSKVRPEIFGAIFEHSLGKDERHAFGAHFTHPTDIMKIVGPTIVEPWRKVIEEADKPQLLRDLWQRMHEYKVLDPACGSGNFLYIAYRELKRLEARLIERLAEMTRSQGTAQRFFGFVSARQFFGLDINPFAVELAKVTMMIARKLAIDELHITEQALPLDNLDDNFRTTDALIDAQGNPIRWPQVDVIVGNPPFLGAKRLKPERGPDYVNAVRSAYPDVPGMADYCVYWFRKAQDQLPPCTAADRLAGHAGLVGTQNIRNNQSRVGGLDYVARTGTIVEAVENQPWSGEANVHVSIANWVKTQDPSLLPSKRKLWHKVEPSAGSRTFHLRGSGPAAKEYELTLKVCDSINSSLSDQADMSEVRVLRCNTHPQRCFNGQMLGHRGFLLSSQQRLAILRKDSSSISIIHPYLNGVDALTRNTFDRYVLDFEQMSQIEAATYSGAFEWVKTHVLCDRERKAREGIDKAGKLRPHHRAFLARWWQLSFGRPEMLSVIKQLPRYLVCALVTKRPIFMFVSSAIRPSNLIQVFGFADDFSCGVLQSHVHWVWFVTKCSKLKSDYRYGAESVFDTFPWPQAPSVTQIDRVSEAARDIRRIRDEALSEIKGGLRALYRMLELPGKNPLKDAHAALDAAVLATYGFSPKKDLLTQLLELNLDVAAREQAGQPVTAPGVPPGYSNPSRLVTSDCIRAD